MIMTNQTPSQNYEASIFNQLVKISEENAVIKYRIDLIEAKVNKIPKIETRLDNIETHLTSIKTQVNKISDLESPLDKIEKIPALIKNGTRTLVITIVVGIIINIFSAPILANLFH